MSHVNAVALTVVVINKTTTAIHLGQYLALKGYRVLMLDLDAQASLANFRCSRRFFSLTEFSCRRNLSTVRGDRQSDPDVRAGRGQDPIAPPLACGKLGEQPIVGFGRPLARADQKQTRSRVAGE